MGNSRDGESVPRDPMLHDRDFPGLAGPAVATATGAATRTRRGVAGVRTILCWHSWRRMGVGCRQALFVCGVDHCCYKAKPFPLFEPSFRPRHELLIARQLLAHRVLLHPLARIQPSHQSATPEGRIPVRGVVRIVCSAAALAWLVSTVATKECPRTVHVDLLRVARHAPDLPRLAGHTGQRAGVVVVGVAVAGLEAAQPDAIAAAVRLCDHEVGPKLRAMSTCTPTKSQLQVGAGVPDAWTAP